ncbi:MAG: hypothetical protein HYX67_05490 [Candidatus Melainabacteria bacterium]|nr:hypothetical protein [Candidatus Melainabacteria bacterium]
MSSTNSSSAAFCQPKRIRCLRSCLALLMIFMAAAVSSTSVRAQVPAPAPSFRRAGPAYGSAQSDLSGSLGEAVQSNSVEIESAGGQSKMLYGQVGVSGVSTGAVKQQQLGLQTGATSESSPLLLRIPRPDNTVPMKSPVELNAERLAAFVERNQDPMATVKVSETARFLSKYDVELIVDASMSMRRRDCPGFASRWEWCGAQSVDLARQLAPFASQGITMTSFNRNFYVYEHQNPQQLTMLFARTPLAPNTRLAEPLADRLNDYVVHRGEVRPRLIAVITDGVPHPFEQAQMVEDVLIHASQMIKDPRELTVVFFQIGSRDFMGQQFLGEIDNKLVARGARFDIVQTVSFDHLQQVGLAQGLADAIRSFDYKTRN